MTGRLVTPRFKKPPKKRPTKNVRAWRQACLDVDARSKGFCEANVDGVCPPGRHRADHHHHVWLRSQGGPDEAWNLMHLCHVVHEWAHRNRQESEQLGIIRRRAS